MNDLIITFKNHNITLTEIDYKPGTSSVTHRLPEDCEEGEGAILEFNIESGIEHYNELLNEHCLDDITKLAYKAIDNMEPSDL